MPTDPQELDRWLSDRNCDLKNAIEFGNPGLVSQIGCLIGQGAGQVAKVGRSSVVEGQSRSAMMSDLIEEQSKRRCLSSSAMASEEFDWEKRPTVCGPADFRTLSRRRSRESGSRFDHVRFVGRRAFGAGHHGSDRLAQSWSTK